MTKYSSKDIEFFLVNGYSIVGLETDFEVSRRRITRETTVLSDTYEQHEDVGITGMDVSQDGFYDDAAGSSNAALVANGGAEVILSVAFEGNTEGQKCVCLEGPVQTSYQRGIAVKEFHRASAEYMANGEVEDCLILADLEARVADSNTSSQEEAASSSSGASGYLQVTNVTLGGYTNCVVKIQHSANDIDWADLITFTAVTDRTAERVEVASGGTINKYLRVLWAWTGAGAAQSITFMAAMYRIPD